MFCKVHPFLCGEEGVSLIKADIADGVNAINIAACSARVNTDVFAFGANIINERTSLRENVVWLSPPNNEDTQLLAEDYIRMGLVKNSEV